MTCLWSHSQNVQPRNQLLMPGPGLLLLKRVGNANLPISQSIEVLGRSVWESVFLIRQSWSYLQIQFCQPLWLEHSSLAARLRHPPLSGPQLQQPYVLAPEWYTFWEVYLFRFTVTAEVVVHTLVTVWSQEYGVLITQTTNQNQHLCLAL